MIAIAKNEKMGVMFALMAALCNSLIGILTYRSSAIHHVPPSTVAFYRCFIAFLLLGPYVAYRYQFKTILNFVNTNKVTLLVQAFFGIFLLYFFESFAFRDASVASVTFVTMSTSTVITLLLAATVLKEKITKYKMLGILVILLGMLFMFVNQFQLSHPSSLGLSLLAGTGYGFFLILTRRNNVTNHALGLCSFFAVGSLYLAIGQQFQTGFVVPLGDVLDLLLLGLIPTLGGFFCTVKALSYAQAHQVQCFELSEPVLSSALAFAVLGQAFTGLQCIGSALVLVGLYISQT